MGVTSIALGGLAAAEGLLQRTAARLSAAGDPAANVDVAGEMVHLMQAHYDLAANTKVLKTDQEMQQYLLDIFA
jgi:flagellar basal body rod protein FlgG